MKRYLILLLFIVISICISTGCSDRAEDQVIGSAPSQTDVITVQKPQASSGEPGYGAIGSFANTDAELEQMLIYAIQDEYLARSEYEYLINNLNAGNPFVNIIRAEEKHIAMLIPLFEKYNFAVPDDISADHLISVSSITDALETGVQAEIDNIAMYEQFLKTELPEDVRDVFTELRDASENHLAAFKRKLGR